MTLAEAYRTAINLQERLGEEASHVAAERADMCLREGDKEGSKDWNKVCAMLAELNRSDRQTAH